MGLIEQANKDIQEITSNLDEWGVNISLQSPNGQTASITGISVKIHLGVNTEGSAVSTKQARVTFSEQNLINANSSYPLRNSKGDVDLTGHIFSVADSTGIVKTYSPQTWTPDEAIGLIMVFLSVYGTD